MQYKRVENRLNIVKKAVWRVSAPWNYVYWLLISFLRNLKQNMCFQLKSWQFAFTRRPLTQNALSKHVYCSSYTYRQNFENSSILDSFFRIVRMSSDPEWFFLLAKAINELCKDLLLNYSQTKQDLIAISGMPRKRSIKRPLIIFWSITWCEGFDE